MRRPQAVRPWQHVLEPLAGYLVLAARLWQEPEMAGAYNFGPATGDAVTVRDVVEMARRAYGKGAVRYGEGSEGPHEAAWLALEAGKARELLGVRPVWTLAEAVARTMAWYRAQDKRAPMRGSYAMPILRISKVSRRRLRRRRDGRGCRLMAWPTTR